MRPRASERSDPGAPVAHSTLDILLCEMCSLPSSHLYLYSLSLATQLFLANVPIIYSCEFVPFCHFQLYQQQHRQRSSPFITWKSLPRAHTRGLFEMFDVHYILLVVMFIRAYACVNTHITV